MDLLTAGVVATSLKAGRAPAGDPPRPPRAHRPRPARADLPRAAATASASASPTSSSRRSVGGLRSRERAARGVRRHPAAQAAGRRPRRAARRARSLWGWPHCVQDEQMTQLAIDRRLTLIAFEAMNHWTADGAFSVHVFHKNNELAGYCSVLHALQLVGLDRRLRPPPARGGDQLRRDRARGGDRPVGARDHDVTVLTQRSVAAVASPIALGADRALRPRPENPRRSSCSTSPGRAARGVPGRARHRRQLHPAGHRRAADLRRRRRPRPLRARARCSSTSPATRAWASSGRARRRSPSRCSPSGDGLRYYAVDHSPSYLWNSATWEISEALLALPARSSCPARRRGTRDETIRRAIEIRDGVIQNPRILSFQGRAATFPYDLLVHG